MTGWQIIARKQCWGTRICADCSWWREEDRPPDQSHITSHWEIAEYNIAVGTFTVFLLFWAAICAAASAKFRRNSSAALVVAATDSCHDRQASRSLAGYWLITHHPSPTAEILQTWSFNFIILRTLAFGRANGVGMPVWRIARWSSIDVVAVEEATEAFISRLYSAILYTINQYIVKRWQ